MGYNFPDAPTLGQVFQQFKWDGEKWITNPIAGGGYASCYFSDTAPSAAIDGALWWHSALGVLYVRYNDGSSTQWVAAQPTLDLGALVKRTGDAMTGPLLLNADPLNALGAATKSYVDNKTAKKNFIINSSMMVSQENGSTAGTTDNYYPADQWFSTVSLAGGAVSITQVASTTPAGSPNRIRCTVTTAQATIGSSYLMLSQRIEGLRSVELLLGKANAKTFTVQLGVKAPAGTYTLNINNYNVTAGQGLSFTIAAGEANIDVVKSVTFSTGFTSGTWNIDNTVGVLVQFVLAKTGSFNLLGTVGNVFELFDVSLTEGTVAPPFQLPDYATELALCQRYWNKILGTARLYATGTNYEIETPLHFPAMRASPVAVVLSGGTKANVTGASPIISIGGVNGGRFEILAAAAGDCLAINIPISLNARL